MEKQLIRITAEKLTRNFTHKEWSLAKYSDKTSYEAPTALIYAVQAIRDWFQGKVLITSTLRKSDKFGFHRLGLAVDLVPSNECLYTMNDYFDELFKYQNEGKSDIIEELRSLGVNGFGIERGNCIHLDVRPKINSPSGDEWGNYCVFSWWLDKNGKSVSVVIPRKTL